MSESAQLGLQSRFEQSVPRWLVLTTTPPPADRVASWPARLQFALEVWREMERDVSIRARPIEIFREWVTYFVLSAGAPIDCAEAALLGGASRDLATVLAARAAPDQDRAAALVRTDPELRRLMLLVRAHCLQKDLH